MAPKGNWTEKIGLSYFIFLNMYVAKKYLNLIPIKVAQTMRRVRNVNGIIYIFKIVFVHFIPIPKISNCYFTDLLSGKGCPFTYTW